MTRNPDWVPGTRMTRAELRAVANEVRIRTRLAQGLKPTISVDDPAFARVNEVLLVGWERLAAVERERKRAAS